MTIQTNAQLGKINLDNCKYCDQHLNEPIAFDFEFEEFVKTRTELASSENRKTGPTGIITIPVVFHIVYKNELENVSDDLLIEQLGYLHDDFNATYEDSINVIPIFQDRIGDFEIEFCLAQQDPNGFPHSGITRTATTIEDFDPDFNAVKFDSTGGKNAWPSDSYFNIWVCDLGNWISRAQSPNGDPDTDGMIMHYQYLSEGELTYTTGTWLGLHNTWGSGDCGVDDFVADTPITDGPNWNCWDTDANSCSNETPDFPDMVQNYMDYSAIECSGNLFTVGQVERGRAIFEVGGPRHSILQSEACQTVYTSNFNVELASITSPTSLGFSCDDGVNINYTIRNFGYEAITALTINSKINDIIVNTENWNGLLESAGTIDFELGTFPVESGIHNLQVEIESVNNSIDDIVNDNSISVEFQVNGFSEEIDESFEQLNFPPNFYEIENPDVNKSWTLNEEVGNTGSNCIYINCYSYSNQATYDDLVLPAIDLANIYNPILEFYSAYALQNESDSDTLEVLISDDCGENFSSLTKLFGNELSSSAATFNEFIPTNSDWKLNTINLSNYINNEAVVVKLRCINSFINNLYIDDIAIKEGPPPVGLELSEKENSISLFPNPSQNNFTVTFNSTYNNSAELYIKDIYGRIVSSSNHQIATGYNQINSVVSLVPGLYLVNIKLEESVFTQKLVISK